MAFAIEALRQTWLLLLQSGAYLLLGFLLAGLIHAFLPTALLSRWLGRPGLGSVLRAALIGTPLPLCSCSVVPVAATLRKAGASRGATSAFLISTPESGVDSIAATWALMDPLMTVARPISAFFTAFVTGVATDRLLSVPTAKPAATALPVSGGGCCCSKPAAPAAASCCGSAPAAAQPGLGQRLLGGVRYGLVDLFEDLARFLVIGFLVAGVVAALLAQFDVLRGALGSSYAPLWMLLAGIPMYVCAAAATPLVAVLISEGLSPGAGLVFLLAGPATNAASIVLVREMLGSRGLALYLAGIAGCALLAGFAVDALYAALSIAPAALTHAEACHTAPTAWQWAGAVGLVLLIANGLVRRVLRLPARPSADAALRTSEASA